MLHWRRQAHNAKVGYQWNRPGRRRRFKKASLHAFSSSKSFRPARTRLSSWWNPPERSWLQDIASDVYLHGARITFFGCSSFYWTILSNTAPRRHALLLSIRLETEPLHFGVKSLRETGCVAAVPLFSPVLLSWFFPGQENRQIWDWAVYRKSDRDPAQGAYFRPLRQWKHFFSNNSTGKRICLYRNNYLIKTGLLSCPNNTCFSNCACKGREARGLFRLLASLILFGYLLRPPPDQRQEGITPPSSW